MKVIVGGPECGKTTVLLHYVYNEIATLLEQNNQNPSDGPTPNKKESSVKPPGSQDYHACIITSKKKMIESKMIFGIYCEVSIETLREVKLKYIEDYEELVQFLTDFHLLPVKPSVLGIDSLEYFIDNKRQGINLLTKQMRLNFLMSLIKDCQQFLDQSIFKQNNLIVSYKVGIDVPLAISKEVSKTSFSDILELIKTMTQSEKDQIIAQSKIEFQRVFLDMTRYTPQVFYIARNEITYLMDEHLLTKVQREKLSNQYIDIYSVAAAPVHSQGSIGAKKTFQSENEANTVQYKVKSIGDSKPSSTQTESVVGSQTLAGLTKYHVFDNILEAIREYQQQDME